MNCTLPDGRRTRLNDPRGNSYARRARRLWLVSPQTPFGGNGETVPCAHCGTLVTADTLEVDRKIPGGTYRRDNIQPSCRPCNLARSDNPDWKCRP